MPNSWYSIKAAAGIADIHIYDEIGGYGISAGDFVKELRDIDAKTINLHLNSPGGDVFDGMAIHSAIRSVKADVIAMIEGLAASIASVIAIACDEVRMAENAFFMIHNPSGLVLGESKDMRKMADELDQIRDQMAKAYAKKTGKETKELASMMDEETWMTADEAKEAGFVDAITDGAEITARFDLTKFNKAPDTLKALVTNSGRTASPVGQTPAEPLQEIPMSKIDLESFKAFAAENPDAVTPFIEQGYTQAKGDLSPKPATIDQLRAVFTAEADKAFCCDALASKLTLDDAKTNYIKAQVEKITALQSERDDLSNKLAKANEGQGAIGTVASAPGGSGDAPDPNDPKAVAAHEWDSNPDVRTGFSSKDNYVNYRKAVLSGSLKVLNK